MSDINEKIEPPEFDNSFNPCSIMSLEDGVGLIALIEMIVYFFGFCGTLALITVDRPNGILHMFQFLIFLLVGLTFPFLFCGSRKRKWQYCILSVVGLCIAFLVRIPIIAISPTDPIGILSGVLSLCEIYSFVVIVAYIIDVRKRPDGVPKVPELFCQPLRPDATSPYVEQILSSDANAASVRKNPRFQNGFP